MELRKFIIAIFLLINSISAHSQQLLSQEALEAAKQNNYQPAIAELTTLVQKKDTNEAALTKNDQAIRYLNTTLELRPRLATGITI